MRPQEVPSQVAAPLAGTGHGVQDVPQVATSELLTQAPLHEWEPARHTESPLKGQAAASNSVERANTHRKPGVMALSLENEAS